MTGYVRRAARLLLGIFLSALGVYCTIQADVGLAPWDALTVGITNVTGLTIGAASIASSVAAVGVGLLLREKVGVGTLLTATLLGSFLDLFYRLGLLPRVERWWLGLPLLLAGLVIISLGSYFYIGAALGCGPRDALTIGLCKRLGGAPIGPVRGGIDLVVLLVGWLLGAKAGVGTLITALCLGPVMQLVFRLLHFDPKAIEHEGLRDSWRLLRATGGRGER